MKKFIAVLALFVLVGGADVAYSQNSAPNNGTTAPELTQNRVVQILQEARAYFGCSLGQLLQAYRSGDCTIEWLQTSPPSNFYRVRLNSTGLEIIIEMDA